jgi:amino acid transporter
MPARVHSPARRFSSGNDSAAWRIALLVFVVASIVWLGAVNVRGLIGNDILKTGTVEFEEYIEPQAEREVYRLLSVSSVAVIIGYSLALISSLVFLKTSPFKFKEHGWLMMSAILFYSFVPVEVYTLILDWKMIYLEFYTTADNESFRELFVARVKALQGVPFIALLSYYTIIVLAVFQPFRKVLPPTESEQVGQTA